MKIRSQKLEELILCCDDCNTSFSLRFTDVVEIFNELDLLELRKLFIQFYPCVTEFDYFVKDLEERADLLAN